MLILSPELIRVGFFSTQEFRPQLYDDKIRDLAFERHIKLRLIDGDFAKVNKSSLETLCSSRIMNIELKSFRGRKFYFGNLKKSQAERHAVNSFY